MAAHGHIKLIERPWRFTKRRTFYGVYHATFADFRAAVKALLAGIDKTHAAALASLMMLNFREIDDVSLLAARRIPNWFRQNEPQRHEQAHEEHEGGGRLRTGYALLPCFASFVPP